MLLLLLLSSDMFSSVNCSKSCLALTNRGDASRRCLLLASFVIDNEDDVSCSGKAVTWRTVVVVVVVVVVLVLDVVTAVAVAVALLVRKVVDLVERDDNGGAHLP